MLIFANILRKQKDTQHRQTQVHVHLSCVLSACPEAGWRLGPCRHCWPEETKPLLDLGEPVVMRGLLCISNVLWPPQSTQHGALASALNVGPLSSFLWQKQAWAPSALGPRAQGTGRSRGHTRNFTTMPLWEIKIWRQEVKILTFGSSPNWPNCTSFNKLRAVLMISLHFFGVSSTFPARKRQQAPVT